MTISSRVARPLLASMFVVGGLEAVRDPESKVKKAEAVTGPLSRLAPALPDDTEAYVKLNGAVQAGAGVMLAVGRFRRLAALALIGSVIPTTYAGHRFWEETDDVRRAQQRTHLLKNLGLLGGLILAATDTEGAPSIGWRAKRSARRLGAVAAMGTTVTGSDVHRAAMRASSAGSRAVRRANRAGSSAGSRAVRKANRAATKASSAGSRAAKKASRVTERAARTGTDVAAPLLTAGVDRAGALMSKAQGHLPVG